MGDFLELTPEANPYSMINHYSLDTMKTPMKSSPMKSPFNHHENSYEIIPI
jgi:hypothetical protein